MAAMGQILWSNIELAQLINIGQFTGSGIKSGISCKWTVVSSWSLFIPNQPVFGLPFSDNPVGSCQETSYRELVQRRCIEICGDLAKRAFLERVCAEILTRNILFYRELAKRPLCMLSMLVI